MDNDKIPVGVILRNILEGHTSEINRIAWSPEGRCLASASQDGTVRVWDVNAGSLKRTFNLHPQKIYSVSYCPKYPIIAAGTSDHKIMLWHADTYQLERELREHSGNVYSVTWSPDGKLLASGAGDNNILIWDWKSGKLKKRIIGHDYQVNTLVWSPDGNLLASGSDDNTIRIWNAKTWKCLRVLTVSIGYISSLAWKPDGIQIASSSAKGIISLWNPYTGKEEIILGGHNGLISCIDFSSDGNLFASKSQDGTVRLWDCNTWDTIASLPERPSEAEFAGISFHPKGLRLATLGESGKSIRIWDIDADTLRAAPPTSETVHYKNAKVVIVGDSGVGKSGLSLVLAGKPWVETSSTHERQVWMFDRVEITSSDGHTETHETFLWDLAGQPDYRIIHQLHLTEVALAIIVFDSKSQLDPLTGVRHWDCAIRHSLPIQSNIVPKRILVAARIDRGNISVSPARIDSLIRELGLEAYFATSAKEGWNISDLKRAIRESIVWENLPAVSSTKLFHSIKNFLVSEKESGHLLSTAEDLYRAYLRSEALPFEADGIRAEFDACIRGIESRGLIQRLSFGNLVLLQPELRDAYASSMIIAAKSEPDGLGYINEDKARSGDFPIPESERIKDKEEEKLLLISTIEELLYHEIALREQGEEGPYLVFPSQYTREHPHAHEPEGQAVIFEFEGALLNVYATLTVRLSHSRIFEKKDMWRNAATFKAKFRGTCGIVLREIDETHGEMVVFFDTDTSDEARSLFEEYVYNHLLRRAISNSVRRRRFFVCSGCRTPITQLQAERRRQRGFDWIECSVCGPPVRISLLDSEDSLASIPHADISKMNRKADAYREKDKNASIIEGKLATNDYDVFLCHNSADKRSVVRIGKLLKEHSILPWLDEWDLRPGLLWQNAIEHQIKRIKAAAVFIGENGTGPWQDLEQAAFLREFVRRGLPVIPVILPDCENIPDLPIFLQGMTWVDFRNQELDALERLIWGITGKRASELVRVNGIDH